jgi:hypothetical protein
MAIPLCGTFQYVATVPENGIDGRPWLVDLQKPIEPTGDDMRDDRLVGHSPTLEISDAGIAPGVPSAGAERAKPRVWRSRITLAAATRVRSRAASVAFYVDRAFTMTLAPDDLLFMSRTHCGRLGLSIVRGGRLIAAAGALSAVPLGDLVRVRILSDTIREAERLFQKSDPEFGFPELPVEVRLGDDVRIMFRGRPRIQSYDVWVEHGFYRGIPGVDECVAISLAGSCPDTAAIASAQLMDSDAIEIRKWDR